LYSGVVDSKIGAVVSYQNSASTYSDIQIASFKPVSGGKLTFKITNLKNTSSDWNSLVNSGNWIDLPSLSGNITNIKFNPYYTIRLKGLGDDVNYVDINNNIYLQLVNDADFNISSDLNLSGEITKPTAGAVFNTWWKIQQSVSILPNSKELVNQDILFDISFHYSGVVKFNYNYWTYSITPSSFNIWTIKLIPWRNWFNLWWIYKLWWVYVNWLVSKVQKLSTSVKTYISRKWTMATNFSTIYNKLKRKVNQLVQGISPETDFTLNISDLNGGVKYYSCDNANQVLNIDVWSYNWNNLVVVKNCKIFIKGNIIKSTNKSSLVIFDYSTLHIINLNNQDYINWPSNIYIAENVSDINAGLLTKGSIFTIEGSSLNNNMENFWNIIYKANRINSINDKQLFIDWMIMSQNNIWWWFMTDWQMLIGASYRLTKDKINTDGMWGKKNILDVRNIAQMFDLSFMRGFTYSEVGPAASWYSDYCKNHTNEQWCKYPVYIKYDSSLKQNILFK